MSVTRKISVRKIMQALLTLVLTGVCLAAVLSATKTQQNRPVGKIDIRIKNSQYGFVTKADVRQMLLNSGNISTDGTKLADVNVKKMEQLIVLNEWVEDAQVYIDNKHNLHALVTQRVPYVRIFEKNGNSYYLDNKMEPLALSTKYTHYTTVVTNVPPLTDSANINVKKEIMAMVKFIKADSFWNAQVSQLIVRDDLKFEIVPVLGSHQVIVGDTCNLDVKFGNLMAFYKNVLNEVGWDKYQVLDLSYNGQLVASPALAWKMPVDKVINRINWVNSIMAEQEKSSAEPIVAKTVQLAALNAKVKEPAPVVAEKKKEVVAATPVKTLKKITPVAKPVKAAAPVKKITPAKEPAAKKAEAKTPVVKKAEVKAKPKATPKTINKKIKKEKEKKPIVQPVQKSGPEKQEHKPEQKQEDKKPKYIYNG